MTTHGKIRYSPTAIPEEFPALFSREIEEEVVFKLRRIKSSLVFVKSHRSLPQWKYFVLRMVPDRIIYRVYKSTKHR